MSATATLDRPTRFHRAILHSRLVGGNGHAGPARRLLAYAHGLVHGPCLGITRNHGER